MVTINGEQLDVAGQTIAQYLATTSFNPQRIAIERNGDFIFKSHYDATILADGDTVEVVNFVGGG